MAEVKKPVGGAFGQFMNEKRAEFAKAAEEQGLKGVTAVSKLAGEAWKNIADEDKKVYEDRYAAAKEAWESFKSSDQYVAPEPKQKRKKADDKKAKDPDAPKKPSGGGFGEFLKEKREEFTKQAKEKEMKGCTGVTKLAGEAWQALPEDEKKVYTDRFQEAKSKYDEDMKAYKSSKAEEEKSSPEKSSPPAKGRKRAAETQAAPAPRLVQGHREATKRGRAAKKASPEPEVDAEVLKEAEGLELKAALLNLAAREEVLAKGLKSSRLLQALKDSAGLVNKAKAVLLGGA